MADGIAGTHLTFHPLPDDVTDLGWTPDGKEIMAKISTGTNFGKYVVASTDVKILDPATGTVHSVPFPAAVEAAVKGKSPDGWLLEGWSGDEDSPVYVLASPQGSRFEWVDERGDVVGTAAIQATYVMDDSLHMTVTRSPSGRYLMISRGSSLGVFDLKNNGVPVMDPRATTISLLRLWTVNDEIVTSAPPTDQVIDIQVRAPNGGTAVQDHRFTVPSYLGDKCPAGLVASFDVGFVPGYEGAFTFFFGGG